MTRTGSRAILIRALTAGRDPSMLETGRFICIAVSSRGGFHVVWMTKVWTLSPMYSIFKLLSLPFMLQTSFLNLRNSRETGLSCA
jgi:hypothetical protein